MNIKSFRQKDRYGNETAVEFFDVPEMQIPQYDHPGEPKGPDTVPAWLTPGEFVVNAEAVRMFEPQIEAMNNIGRDIQKAQGGTIPEGGTVPDQPVYAGDGSFIQGAVDFFTMPKAPPGIVYKRLDDGSIGQFTERTGTGGGQKYLGRLSQPKKEKGNAFSKFIGMSEGGAVYANEGLTANELLRQFLMRDDVEGFTSEPKKDTNGYAIGFGSTRDVTADTKPIDRDQAMLLLDRDITDANNAYNRLVTADLNPYQQAAVNSLIYNIGQGRFGESEALKRLNAGDFEGYLNEADEFRLANGEVLPGLVNRRALERDLFSTPYQVANNESLLSKLGIISGANAQTNTVPAVTNSVPQVNEEVEDLFRLYNPQHDTRVPTHEEASKVVLPKVSDFNQEDTDSGFNILTPKGKEALSNFGDFITGLIPTNDYDQTMQGYNAEANRKIVAGNAESVAETFEQFEMKRLNNLANGRGEFDGINIPTYNKAKQAVEFQQDQLINATQKSLDLNNVDRGLADAAINKLSNNVSELGVPKPEDLAIYQSDGYQAMLGRAESAGVTPDTVDDYVEKHTVNEDGVAPIHRIVGKTEVDKDSTIQKNIDEVAEIVQSEVITGDEEVDAAINQVQNAAKNGRDPDSDQIAASAVANAGTKTLQGGDGQGDDTKTNAIFDFFKDAFSDLFDGKELARMAIMYAGSRALGYDHFGSLNYSMKNYIKRVDADIAQREKFISSKAAIETYTAASLQKYRETGDRNLLEYINKGSVKDQSGQLYVYGLELTNGELYSGILPKVTLNSGNAGVVLPSGQTVDLNDIAGKYQEVDKNIHDRFTVSENNFKVLDEALKRANNKYGLENENRLSPTQDIADQATDILISEIEKYGANPRKQRALQQSLNVAIRQWAEDNANYAKNGGPRDPYDALRFYFDKQKIVYDFKLPPALVQDADPYLAAELMNVVQRDAELDKDDAKVNFQKASEVWGRISKAIKGKKNKGQFNGYDQERDDGHTQFTWWLSQIYADDPGAIELFNKYATAKK